MIATLRGARHHSTPDCGQTVDSLRVGPTGGSAVARPVGVRYASARRGRATLTAEIASTPTCRVGSSGPFHARRVSSRRGSPAPHRRGRRRPRRRRRWSSAASVRAPASGRLLARRADGLRRRGRRRSPSRARRATSRSTAASTPRRSSRTTPTGRWSCADARLQLRRGTGRGRTFDTNTAGRAVRASREGLDAIAVDGAALAEGLVVVPRESHGRPRRTSAIRARRHAARRPPVRTARRAGLDRRARGRRSASPGARPTVASDRARPPASGRPAGPHDPRARRGDARPDRRRGRAGRSRRRPASSAGAGPARGRAGPGWLARRRRGTALAASPEPPLRHRAGRPATSGQGPGPRGRPAAGAPRAWSRSRCSASWRPSPTSGSTGWPRRDQPERPAATAGGPGRVPSDLLARNVGLGSLGP